MPRSGGINKTSPAAATTTKCIRRFGSLNGLKLEKPSWYPTSLDPENSALASAMKGFLPHTTKWRLFAESVCKGTVTLAQL